MYPTYLEGRNPTLSFADATQPITMGLTRQPPWSVGADS